MIRLNNWNIIKNFWKLNLTFSLWQLIFNILQKASKTLYLKLLFYARDVLHNVFLRNTFSKAGSMFLKIYSIWAWNVSYKFWFIPLPKNDYLQCARTALFVCLFFSSKLNLLSSRDGVYSFEYDFVCLFWCKKNLGEIYVARVCSLLYENIAL